MSTCEKCGVTGNVPAGCFDCGEALDQRLVELSPTWRQRFAAIAKAGGPTLVNLRKCPLGQRFTALFNFPALLFGPLYYLFRGMWRKALSLTALVFGIALIMQVIAAVFGLPEESFDNVVRIASIVLFTQQANLTYYRKMVLGQNGWW